MGDVRALNVWLSLSHCGDDAPGLDIVPRRLDADRADRDRGRDLRLVGRRRPWREEAAGDEGPVRPIFEPGDVLLFDELCLHSTALDPAMTEGPLRGRVLVLRALGLSRRTTSRWRSELAGTSA